MHREQTQDTGFRVSSEIPAAPRGVAPPILIAQVRNTAPFVLSDFHAGSHFAPLRKDYEGVTLSHVEYFRLCLCAHHATVATYVPTDVDNQIRFRLWHPSVPSDEIVEMVEIVEKCKAWDPRTVSGRFVVHPRLGVLSGHNGEWFSTAVAAYGATRRRAPEISRRVLEQIEAEILRGSAIFEDGLIAGDGILCLKVATILAHNLGDLDRVIEMWNLSEEDPLRARFFQLGHTGEKRFPILTVAGNLNKALMAFENHRFFALRRPKCLRRSAELLIHTPPFLDDWGRTVCRHPLLSPKEIAEVAETLIDGWEWLFRVTKENGAPIPVGYARALAGILESFPGGERALHTYLPARPEKMLRTGHLRRQIGISRARFEQSIAASALKFCKNLL